MTAPRPYDVVKSGSDWVYHPTNLITGEADLKTSPKQVVTYKINPAAKWSDGQPITAHDFKYLWDQIVNGSDIYDTTGYANIESVDDTNPAQPVVTFSKPFADWKSLFGGTYGLFPSHLLEGKDRDKETADGYTWSGGPWMMTPGGWQKGTQLTLVPNPGYWGTKPKLDKLVVKFITDSSANGPNAIIVVDLATGQSWRRLNDHPTVKAEPNFTPIIEGQPWLVRPPPGLDKPAPLRTRAIGG